MDPQTHIFSLSDNIITISPENPELREVQDLISDVKREISKISPQGTTLMNMSGTALTETIHILYHSGILFREGLEVVDIASGDGTISLLIFLLRRILGKKGAQFICIDKNSEKMEIFNRQHFEFLKCAYFINKDIYNLINESQEGAILREEELPRYLFLRANPFIPESLFRLTQNPNIFGSNVVCGIYEPCSCTVCNYYIQTKTNLRRMGLDVDSMNLGLSTKWRTIQELTMERVSYLSGFSAQGTVFDDWDSSNLYPMPIILSR